MRDPRLDRLARVLVRYSVEVKRGDVVAVSGSTAAAPLAEAVYRETLEARGHPWVRLVPGACAELLLKHGGDEQLGYVHSFDREVIRRADVTIGIWAEDNTKSLSRCDPAKQALRGKARRPLMAMAMKRGALPRGDPKRLRWTGTVFPTHAAAQDAEMSLGEYEDFVYRAGKLNVKDPVAAWRKLGDAQRRLCDALARGREMRITTRDGTDLRLGIEGRTWISCDGKENFPDGEVFTGPVEDATEGTVVFPFPAVHGGRQVEGVRLTFRAGRVVDCSADRNEEFLVRMLDQDRGARVLGELALGSNYDVKEHTKNTLFDEKIGGTFHVALGASYPESGGKNKSALHWDLVGDLRRGGLVEVDGKPVSRDGRFADRSWPR